jgi:hypothetical protein
VRAESGVEAENEALKTIQEHVKTRTFSAQTAEKVRHPAGFNRAGVHSGAARKGSPPASAPFFRALVVSATKSTREKEPTTSSNQPEGFATRLGRRSRQASSNHPITQ